MKKYLRNAICYIIAVPTPIHKNRKPNLNMIIEASKLVGKFLNKGDYVIYESTIFLVLLKKYVFLFYRNIQILNANKILKSDILPKE